MAVAVVGAAGVVWARRRRRYVPGPLNVDRPVDDPDLEPLPRTVRSVRRRLPSEAPVAPGEPEELRGTNVGDARPGDGEATVVLPPGGVCQVGAGALAAVRGVLVATLAAGHADPHAQSEVIVPAGTLTVLLGAGAGRLPGSPRLITASGTRHGVELAEQYLLYRARILADHDAPDVAAVRREHPDEEPLPPIILIVEASALGADRARTAALLADGHRLGVYGVLVGPWPDGVTVEVATDGTITGRGDPEPVRDGVGFHDGRLSVLSAAETGDLLAVVLESHPDATAPEVDDAPLGDVDTGHNEKKPAVVPAEVDDGAGEAGPTRAGTTEGLPGSDPVLSTPPAPALRARVQVLGQPGIEDTVGRPPAPVEPLRAKSLELLVYLAAQDGHGATQEAILDDLLPDAPARKAPERLHTYVYSLRRALRRAAGGTAPDTYLAHTGDRYALTDQVDVDLWRMREAITEASATTDPVARVDALRDAVAAYRGPLAEGRERDYEWVEPYRERVRRQALDAHLALADAVADRPVEALAVLTAAMRHAPYAEPVYQRAMRLHAGVGHTDAVTATLRELTRRLAEIDAAPGEDTRALAAELLPARPARAYGGDRPEKRPRGGGVTAGPGGRPVLQ